MLRIQALAVLLATLAGAVSCSAVRDPSPRDVAATQQEITRTLERYMIAARAVDADAIASFFAPTAVLLEPGIAPVQSRESIRAFMASFPGVRVEVATATLDTIEVFGDTVLLWGSYFERLAFPGQPVSEQHGKFVIEWVRQSDGAWIQRFFRVPVPSPRSSPLGGTP